MLMKKSAQTTILKRQLLSSRSQSSFESGQFIEQQFIKTKFIVTTVYRIWSNQVWEIWIHTYNQWRRTGRGDCGLGPRWHLLGVATCNVVTSVLWCHEFLTRMECHVTIYGHSTPSVKHVSFCVTRQFAFGFGPWCMSTVFCEYKLRPQCVRVITVLWTRAEQFAS